MIEAIHVIASRTGIGELLADGVRAAAARIGQGAEGFAIHVKGLEVPYHDPRAFVSIGANYATANRGACHLEAITYWMGYGIKWEGWYPPEGWNDHDSTGKGRVAADFQNYVGVYNPLGICKFVMRAKVGPQQVTDLVNAALGWGWSMDDLLQTGERLCNLKRLINLRLGITGADDILPKRFLTEPRPSGGAEGVLPDMGQMMPEYYQARGWTPEGVPTQERLAALAVL
jgi:aldehyde:ferredoxin oxidoreductase